MVIENTDVLRSAKDMDSTMMRFISKDGVNEYPTVILLLDRYFLSDDLFLGGDKKFSTKVKLGDSFFWHRSTDIRTEIRASLAEAIGNCQFFELDPSSLYLNISKYWKTSNATYVRINGVLYRVDSITNDTSKGTVVPSILETESIVEIFSVDSTVDFIFTPHYVFAYDTQTKTTIVRYNDNERDLTSACLSGKYLIMTSTNKSMIVYNHVSSKTETLTFSDIKRKTWFITDPNSTSSSSPGQIMVDNQISTDNMTYCFSYNENEIEVGAPSFSCRLNIANYLSSNMYAGSVAGNAGSAVVSFKGKSYLGSTHGLYDGTGTYPTSGAVKSVFENGSIIAILDITNRVYVYSIGQYQTHVTKHFNFDQSTGLPSVAEVQLHSVYISDDNIINFLGTTKVYRDVECKTDNDDYPFVSYAVNYVYDNDCKKKVVKPKVLCLGPLALTKLCYDDKFYSDNYTTVDGLPVTFVYFKTVRKNSPNYWYAYGYDNRRDTTFKQLAEAFDIG